MKLLKIFFVILLLTLILGCGTYTIHNNGYVTGKTPSAYDATIIARTNGESASDHAKARTIDKNPNLAPEVTSVKQTKSRINIRKHYSSRVREKAKQIEKEKYLNKK